MPAASEFLPQRKRTVIEHAVLRHAVRQTRMPPLMSRSAENQVALLLVAAGAGSITYQLNILNADGVLDEASIIGLVVAALIVFASFLAGGFAAGRMSRYSGGLNGLGAGLWLILLVAIFAALGAWVGAEYNAFSQVDLPNWFAQVDVDDVTGMAIAASAVLVVATLLGGYVGGRLGETYHTKVDAALVEATRKEV